MIDDTNTSSDWVSDFADCYTRSFPNGVMRVYPVSVFDELDANMCGNIFEVYVAEIRDSSGRHCENLGNYRRINDAMRACECSTKSEHARGQRNNKFAEGRESMRDELLRKLVEINNDFDGYLFDGGAGQSGFNKAIERLYSHFKTKL